MDFFRYWFYKALHPSAITLRRSSGALGDNLLLSCLARELRRAKPNRKIIIESSMPEMFENNPHVDLVITGKMALFYYKIKYLIEPSSTIHLIDQMIGQLPFAIKDHKRSVDFYFKENSDFSYLSLPQEFIVLNPSGKQSHSANRKEWGCNNFTALRERFPEMSFVQIGDMETPLIPKTLDFRGRTIIESAWIMKNALTGVYLEGGMMHLAESVKCPSVIIYGGVVDPLISGYERHRNISTKPYCSPCFTSHKTMVHCDTMICMKEISVDAVFKAVKELISIAADKNKFS